MSEPQCLAILRMALSETPLIGANATIGFAIADQENDIEKPLKVMLKIGHEK